MEKQTSKSREAELLERYDKLFEHLQQAPKSRVILVRLADVCMDLGRREEALGFYKRAINFGLPPEGIKQKLMANFSQQELEGIEFPAEVLPFWNQMGTVLSYPFSALGILVILLGAVVYTIVTFALYMLGGALSVIIDAPSLRIFSQRFMPVCLLFVSLYLFAYMVKIVDATSKADMVFPPWPGFTDFWEHILRPGLLVVISGAVSFFFAGIVIIFVSPSSVGGTLLLLLCFFVGSPVFPMALLAGIKQDSLLACFSFPLMLSSIQRIKRAYLFVLISLWSIGIICALLFLLMRRLLFPLNVAGISFFWGVAIYFALIFGYILGNVFYVNRRTLTELEGGLKR